MKEASGEANMTVITIVLIAAIAAIATPIITTSISNMGKQSCCDGAGGYWKNGKCLSVSNNAEMAESTYWDSTNKTCK